MHLMRCSKESSLCKWMELENVILSKVCMPTGQKRAPNTITDGCEPRCGCWKLNSGPLEEQATLLTSKPSLQPPPLAFYIFLFPLPKYSWNFRAWIWYYCLMQAWTLHSCLYLQISCQWSQNVGFLRSVLHFNCWLLREYFPLKIYTYIIPKLHW